MQGPSQIASQTLYSTKTIDERLQQYQRDLENGAFPMDPTLRLALEMHEGRFSEKDLANLSDQLKQDALLTRAKRLADWIGTTNEDDNRNTIIKAGERLTLDEQGRKVPVEDFGARLHNQYGAVYTGHPCFNKSPEVYAAIANLFTAYASGDQERIAASEAELKDRAHLEHTPPTLDSESEQSIEGIKNIHVAFDTAERAMIEVGRENYPEDWHTIDYCPFTTWTWIPFDWDGRADITWQKLMEKRLVLQAHMLSDYQARTRTLLDKASHYAMSPEDVEILRDISQAFGDALKQSSSDKEFYEEYDHQEDSGYKKLAEEINRLHQDTPKRITHPQEIVEKIQTIIDRTNNDDFKAELVHLRSRLNTHGLTLAHIHFRLNSKSVSAAMHEKFAKTDNGASGQAQDLRYLPAVERLLAANDDKPRKEANLIDVERAEETLYRQMMLIQQFVDYIDSHSPIRYLIAETESATVPLMALAVAKELGIDKHIDISPLFEDRNGVEAAEEVVKKLFANEQYRQYIVDRGYVSFQLGYSDSGRYDGQLPSGAYMEKTMGKIIFKQAKACMEKYGINFGVYLFPTGGEGTGRGRHPVSLKQAISYHHPEFILAKSRQQGIKVHFESAFQGGDGYLLHGTPQASLAFLAGIADHFSQDHTASTADYYYGDGSHEAHAFYEDIRELNKSMSEDPVFAELLSVFSAMMPKTGSRPVKRAQTSGGERKLPRAIPHNGILAQLGYLVNVCYGIGTSIEQHPNAFQNLIEKSAVFRFRIALADNILQVANPYILKNYVDLYSPEFWQNRARMAKNPTKQQNDLAIADHLNKMGLHRKLSPIVNTIIFDFEKLQTARAALKYHEKIPQAPADQSAIAKVKLNLQAMHGERLTAIMEIFEAAIQIPELSGRHDINREQLVSGIMMLDPQSVEKLEEIFQDRENTVNWADFDLTKESDFQKDPADYRDLNQDITKPIEKNMASLVKTSHMVMDLTPIVTG